jgi:hypothetical protein
MAELAYPTLVFVHLLLFVLWLGGDVGVYMLGQHFRKRSEYSLDQRLALLKLLVEVDMVPRIAWALMVPVSLSVVSVGGYWAVPAPLLLCAWIVGGVMIWLALDAHTHQQTDRGARDRKIEFWIKNAVGVSYLALGGVSLIANAPLSDNWLALKALMFGLIFGTATMIDVAFKPVGSQLGRLIKEGSKDDTELPLLRTMNKTRVWVWIVYLLLILTAYLGVVKPL